MKWLGELLFPAFGNEAESQPPGKESLTKIDKKNKQLLISFPTDISINPGMFLHTSAAAAPPPEILSWSFSYHLFFLSFWLWKTVGNVSGRLAACLYLGGGPIPKIIQWLRITFLFLVFDCLFVTVSDLVYNSTSRRFLHDCTPLVDRLLVACYLTLIELGFLIILVYFSMFFFFWPRWNMRVFFSLFCFHVLYDQKIWEGGCRIFHRIIIHKKRKREKSSGSRPHDGREGVRPQKRRGPSSLGDSSTCTSTSRKEKKTTKKDDALLFCHVTIT